MLSPLIIGADFNAHNNLWGSYKNDRIGFQIINAADDLNLLCLNDGQSTRVERPGLQKSVVDISLSSPDISILKWSVTPDTLGSDHFPILMEFDSRHQINDTIFPKSKWNIKKANWDLYSSHIHSSFITIPNFSNLNEKWNYLLNCINRSAEISIPKLKPFKIKNRPPAPWWDFECDNAIKERKTALNLYKQSPTLENFLNCNLISARTKKFLSIKLNRVG